ncbi:MAG: Extracellular solute-binding protein [Deltaproteobacteria bacterium]|nr:Extracellular solute-binding protein [Deltaproteobacteria bacterium]
MNIWRKVFSFHALVLLLFWSTLAKAAESEDRGKLVDMAHKEGSVVFYTSMDAGDARSLTQAFQKKYPGIKTDFYRAGREAVFSRFALEQKAARYVTDVVSVGEFHVLEMKKQGLITRYLSPEMQAFAPEFKDPQGYWTCVYLTVAVLAYNTNRVKPEELPRRYEDLLSPKWKSRMALDANEERWVPGLMQSMGRDKTVNFLKALAQQDIYIRRGRSLLTQLLLAGEFDVQIVAYWHEVNRLMKQKAPIGWVGMEPAISGAPQISLVTKAPHPNAARLFIDFVISAEGQGIIAKLGRVAARPGIKPEGYPEKLKLFLPNAELIAAQLEENHKLYESLFLKK